ncbi:hypothetical protein [Nonomuraea sp. NEAU-A123]|uniref:hypothetical protein n=1 Tax=Nonomuraea sp. NEAU-A123 TaxID=2839649 RepID=UPI001BE3E1C9|nr:hypothetical protein [Nonomuraea sp. NEAU-A123]MBT2225172.1 hypothetical protein [Nonomuraea sp. NEAU-A123]
MDTEEHIPIEPSEPPAESSTPHYAVPQRPDGWPNWLGRRPMRTTDRAKIREALEAGLPDGPFLCSLTIGIQGPDAQERINQLRNALAKLITKHRWTVRYEPR